jgi:2-polyprenyl-6-methoxyphenol hydroxylase-like FAD-dependent oxidoreductase
MATGSDRVMTSTASVAIAGAGLSGLCLAQALVRAGVDVQVYERDASLYARRQGYRITLDQFGTQALKQCLPAHLFDLALATASVPEDVGYFRYTNRRLGEIFTLAFPRDPQRAIQEVLGQVDRTVLRSILMSELGDRVHFGKAAKRTETSADGVSLYFTDGSLTQASVVVGADGVHSALREQLLPDAPPRDTGYRAIYGRTLLIQDGRSLVPAWLKDSGVFALGAKPGEGFFFATMRFQEAPQVAFARLRATPPPFSAEDYVMWALIFPQEALPTELLELQAEELHGRALEAARRFHPVLRRLVEHATVPDTIAVPLNAGTRPTGWSGSRVTLMGDAVHVMPPLGAHGGNTALCDAALLADKLISALHAGDPIERTIRSYQEEMIAADFKEVDSAVSMLRRMTSKNLVTRWAMTSAVPWLRSLGKPALNAEEEDSL